MGVAATTPTTTFVIVGPAATDRRAPLIVGSAAVTFFACQLLWLLRRGRGWWFDEAIDNVVARRTLGGDLKGDKFLTWITGTPLSPLLSGFAARLGGLTGARLLSTVTMTLSGVALAAAAQRYGRKWDSRQSAAIAIVVMLTSAPAMVYGHLVSHDVLAAGFLSAAVLVLHLHVRSRHHDSAVAVGVLLAMAVLSKYTVGVLLPAFAAYLVAVCRAGELGEASDGARVVSSSPASRLRSSSGRRCSRSPRMRSASATAVSPLDRRSCSTSP